MMRTMNRIRWWPPKSPDGELHPERPHHLQSSARAQSQLARTLPALPYDRRWRHHRHGSGLWVAALDCASASVGLAGGRIDCGVGLQLHFPPSLHLPQPRACRPCSRRSREPTRKRASSQIEDARFLLIVGRSYWFGLGCSVCAGGVLCPRPFPSHGEGEQESQGHVHAHATAYVWTPVMQTSRAPSGSGSPSPMTGRGAGGEDQPARDNNLNRFSISSVLLNQATTTTCNIKVEDRLASKECDGTWTRRCARQ